MKMIHMTCPDHPEATLEGYLLDADITLGQAGLYALLGYAVVFFGLFLLMLVVIAIIAILVAVVIPVVGNSTELKNCILFDGVQVPHFNYVGDSVLGWKAHMGAGSVTSNVKSDRGLVVVKNGEEKVETGLKKFGAMLGDHVEVGCNSVLNPGTVIGPHSNIYPTSCVRGVVPENSIWKTGGIIVTKI